MNKINPVHPGHKSCLSCLHGFLLIGQRYVHLLQRDLVERAGDLQTFRLLILPQSIPRRIIKLPDLLSRVKASLFENRLGVVDLFFGGAKDRASLGALLRAGFGC